MNLNLFPLFLFISLTISLDLSELDRGIDPVSFFCNKTLLESYGLIGSEEPINIKLSMCPNVIKSCCLFSDQITIYEQWEHKKEHGHMMDRFKMHQEIYGGLIEAASKIQDYANSILKKMKKERISNCKIYAKRIVHFEFKDMALRLKGALVSMHEFFERTYSGFYCSLCDAENHKFIRKETSEVIYSERFCRDLTAQSLNVLLYFHVHMMKYLNMLLKFTTFCDANGYYTAKAISSDDLFYVIGEDKRMLETCRDFRNAPNWFEKCVPICEKFRINSYDFLFEPHLKKYKTFAKVLSEAGALFDKSEGANLPVLDLGDTLRVLSEEGAGRVNTTSSFQINQKDVVSSSNPFPSQKLIMSGENGLFNLDTFDNVFEEEGISLFEVGGLAQVNEVEFLKIVAEMKKMSLEKESAFLGKVISLVIGFGLVLFFK